MRAAGGTPAVHDDGNPLPWLISPITAQEGAVAPTGAATTAATAVTDHDNNQPNFFISALAAAAGTDQCGAAMGCAAAEWAAMRAAGACAAAATAAAHDGDDALPCLMPLGDTGDAESTHISATLGGDAAEGTTVAAEVGMGHHSQSKVSRGKQQVGPQLGLAAEATAAGDTARAAVQLSPAQLRRRAARAAVWVLHFGRLRMEQHGQQPMGCLDLGCLSEGAWELQLGCF